MYEQPNWVHHRASFRRPNNFCNHQYEYLYGDVATFQHNQNKLSGYVYRDGKWTQILNRSASDAIPEEWGVIL